MSEESMQCLRRIRIVLVNTSHPGNIGAAARAMKTMCLSDLVLVSPKLFPHADATARASGADDILASAHVVETLDEALTDCKLVIGASARLRRLGWPQLDPMQTARRVLLEVEQGYVALVFGREDSGLSNDELERCHFLLHIDTNPTFSSLNLAAAVQLTCYEIQRQFSGKLGLKQQGKRVLDAESDLEQYVNSEQMTLFYRHLEVMLMEIGFLDPHHPRKMMRRLKRLFNRSRLTLIELNIMRGILSGIEKLKIKSRDGQ